MTVPADVEDGTPRSDHNVVADLRSDEHALMWLLDLLSPVQPARGGRVRRYGVLPRPEAPRYLIPIDAPGTSGTLLVRSGNSDAVIERALRFALRIALRLGVTPILRGRVSMPDGAPGSPSLVQWLELELGRTDLVMAVAIGPPRPNRKPILQVMTADGQPVCFAKVAVDELTGELVRTESAFLAGYAPRGFVVPELLALDTWKGHEVAMLSVLPLGGQLGDEPFLELTAEILLEIAETLPLSECAVLSSAWWTRTITRCELMGAPWAERLASYTRALADHVHGDTWRFGAWHGDLTTWNARWVDGRLHIWDWERTGGPVPLGFDAIHAEFQVAYLSEHLSVAGAADQVASTRGPVLERLGIAPDQWAALIGCYRLELCLRLLDAKQSGPIGDLEALATELLSSPIGTGPR